MSGRKKKNFVRNMKTAVDEHGVFGTRFRKSFSSELKRSPPSLQKKCCSKRSAGMPPNTGLAQRRTPMRQKRRLVFGMDCDTDTLGL